MTLDLVDGDQEPLVLVDRTTVLELPIREGRAVELPIAPARELVLSPAPVPGPPGPSSGRYAATAGDPLPLLTVIYLDNEDLARRASSANLATAVRAIAVSAEAATPGQTIELAGTGAEVEHDLALPSGPAYLGVDGEVTVDRNTGLVRLRIGTLSPGRLIVDLQPTIRRTTI